MPDHDDAVSEWLARLERQLQEHTVIDSNHAAQPGHSGHADILSRVSSLEKEQKNHEKLAGHSAHADLLSRIGRLEYGVAGTLVGIIFLIVKAFLPGGH